MQTASKEKTENHQKPCSMSTYTSQGLQAAPPATPFLLSISQRHHLSFISKFSDDKMQRNCLPVRAALRSPTFIHYFPYLLVGSLMPAEQSPQMNRKRHLILTHHLEGRTLWSTAHYRYVMIRGSRCHQLGRSFDAAPLLGAAAIDTALPLWWLL